MVLSVNKPQLNQEQEQLHQSQIHLELIILALTALTNITDEEVKQAALELDLAPEIAEYLISSKNHISIISNPKTATEQSLILLIAYLSHKHQELIRRAVTLWEQMTVANIPLDQSELLANYLTNFTTAYTPRKEWKYKLESEKLQALALKLLVDLLFYSSRNGHHRLWRTISC